MAKPGESAGGGDSPILAALTRLLRPLVRLLIARSIPFTHAADLLRWVYVDVAAGEFEIEGKPQTDSRVSLLTGIHRREVKRLRRRGAPALRAPKSATLSAQLISSWTAGADYLDAAGRPRPLPYAATDPREASFESLVRSISTDIRPRVVLDEWLRLGLAHLEGELIYLDVDAFIPTQGAEELAYYFGRNLHDHVAAAVNNLQAAGRPLLERGASYNNLSAAAVEELDGLAREEAMRALRAVDQRARELQRRDAGSAGARHRINFGAYFFTEETAAADAVAEDTRVAEDDGKT